MNKRMMIALIGICALVSMPGLSYAQSKDEETWNPMAEMEQMRANIDRMFKNAFDKAMAEGKMMMHGQSSLFEPNLGMKETQTAYIITVDLPGMKKEDIKVEVKDRVLTISGERKSESEVKTEKVIKEERSYGSFLRSLTLPDDADTSHISAEYKEGVLNITMPRLAEMKKDNAATKIEVK